MKKQILVPFDGSPSSIKAVKFTVEMVREGDEIVLINVQKPQYDRLEQSNDAPDAELDSYYLNEGEKVLRKAYDLYIKDGITVTQMVRIGLPSIEITKAAKEIEVNSIVMGSRGMSPMVSNVLGSVTYSVIHLSPCPVTIIPLRD